MLQTKYIVASSIIMLNVEEVINLLLKHKVISYRVANDACNALDEVLLDIQAYLDDMRLP